jgi:hypothetical protein
MVVAALILIPVGRGLALEGLLAVVWLLARTLGREAGWTAVASAYLPALWVYGDPRFQSRIDDPQTIRLSAVVLVVGSALALLGMAQRHRHRAHGTRHIDRRSRRRRKEEGDAVPPRCI